MCHGQLYQQRMKKAFDKKVKPRVFREGDLVLKKVLSFAPDSRGKWTPNYEGPYVVKRAFSGGALMLTTMDGEDFTRPVNSDAIFVEVVPRTELLLGLFPSILANRVLLKTSFSPAAVFPAWSRVELFVDIPIGFANRVVVTLPSAVASGIVCFLSTIAFFLKTRIFNHLFLSIVCRMFVVAASPVEYSFNPQYGRMMAVASSKRIDFLTVCDPQ
ncbi:hypothetical protein KIW84_061785 [Lathyrus oleraceus]|uniref:Uncharacterized protein n=1 Tax=Pisum sativum TaxID=3888 RepID=A0A9D4W4Q0_PEA|nr:hypothetical protein KIW84_061785 [Pisum sativum]